MKVCRNRLSFVTGCVGAVRHKYQAPRSRHAKGICKTSLASEVNIMTKFKKTLLSCLGAGAATLPITSVQAWWGGPGWGGPGWGRGYNDWLGDGLGDMWGDGDFSMGFSARGSGRGYGRGYGDYYDYYRRYPYWGGYPGYGWGGYPGPYGWGAPYAAPPAAPQQGSTQSSDK